MDRPNSTACLRGAAYFAGFLSAGDQQALVDQVRDVVRAAPLFHPVTARGKTMSVRMTSAGQCGWVSDQAGYRYDPQHPSGAAWPEIPPLALQSWRRLLPDAVEPDSCLINFYSNDAKMGLHQDRDEADLTHPVLSLSLGDDALFRIGNHVRGGSTDSLWLRSGDAIVLAGDARLRFHGIDKVRAGSSTLLLQGGRLNLTLRVAGQGG